jgi:hypothetical protein
MTSLPEDHIHTMNQKGFKELAEVELVGKTTHPSKTCHNNFFLEYTEGLCIIALREKKNGHVQISPPTPDRAVGVLNYNKV